jgi:BirA family biotin operon repressor/biotin-[acetyl-CoA-carboxylase] ligase
MKSMSTKNRILAFPKNKREDNDILSVQGMIPFLCNKELAGRIIVYASLESTNKTAKEMAMSEAKHGTVIIADCQTAGKGRYGRHFFSPPGHGIYMSLILHPSQLRFHTPTLVTSLAAVSVCEGIEAISEKAPKIKWVNDIFLGEKKICGILTEAVTDYKSGNVEWIVVGIGINFTTPANDFPEDLRHLAGAVFSRDRPTVTRNQLVCEVINRIMAMGNSWDEQSVLSKYKSRLMMLGERVFISEAEQSYEATAIDIDDIGRLVVKKDDGQILALTAGEISVRT